MIPLHSSRRSVSRIAKRRLAAVAVAATCLWGLPAQAIGFGGNAAITTDYVWRGTSQSNEDPAVQAGFKVSGNHGVYAQVWGSSVEFAPSTEASAELDAIVGWSGTLTGDWSLDANLTHYRYPSTTVDLDWTELNATLTWRGNYWLQAAWSNDALAGGEGGTYVQAGARFPLSDTFRVEAAVGHYSLDRASGYDDYAHAQLGAVWAFKAPFELRVTVHDTDASAERAFGEWAGSRVEAALQASF